MNVKKYFLAILILTFFSATKAVEIECTIDSIITSIKNQDETNFNDLFFDKKLSATEEDFEYYFGKTKKLFLNKNLRYVIFNGNEQELYSNGDEALVVFYDKSLISEVDKINWYLFEKKWLGSLVALELKKIQDRWYFKNTPFFFFRQPPWVKEYG